MTHQRSAVLSRSLDFWFLGGASLVLWAAMRCSEGFRSGSWAIDHHFLELASLSSALSLVVNHPHFMVSYRIAYGRGWRFIIKHGFSLIGVPLGLAGLFVLAYLRFDDSIGSEPWASINWALAGVGFDVETRRFVNAGSEILSFLALLMFATVGWHYAKQAFGCVMVYSKYERYPLSANQRRAIKVSLFSIWWLGFAHFYSGQGENRFFGVRIIASTVPAWFFSGLIGVSLVAIATVLLGVVGMNWRRHKALPSATLSVPWLAFIVWWGPWFRQEEFLAYAVPFFHGLQYLPFAYRARGVSVASREFPFSLLGVLIAGFLAFELLPGYLDAAHETQHLMGAPFFMIASGVFINVHHFFIDSVCWRLGDSEVRGALFSPEITPAA